MSDRRAITRVPRVKRIISHGTRNNNTRVRENHTRNAGLSMRLIVAAVVRDARKIRTFLRLPMEKKKKTHVKCRAEAKFNATRYGALNVIRNMSRFFQARPKGVASIIRDLSERLND